MISGLGYSMLYYNDNYELLINDIIVKKNNKYCKYKNLIKNIFKNILKI